MRLIDADALIARLDYCVKEGLGETIAHTFRHMIHDAPTIEPPTGYKRIDGGWEYGGVPEEKQNKWYAEGYEQGKYDATIEPSEYLKTIPTVYLLEALGVGSVDELMEEAEVMDEIESYRSLIPDHKPNAEPSGDLISRADAIEAICGTIMSEFDYPPNVGYEIAEKALKTLPSASDEPRPIKVRNDGTLFVNVLDISKVERVEVTDGSDIGKSFSVSAEQTIVGIDIPYGSDKGLATVFKRKDDKLILEEVKEIVSAEPQLLEDGTLVVNVPNAEKVGRVLIEDGHSGGLYYHDSAERVGEWIDRERCQVDEDAYEVAICSSCKAEITLEYPHDNYCPNCGAKMGE